MAHNLEYRGDTSDEPTRAAIDATQKPTVLEFGAEWCPICQSAQPLIAGALANFPSVDHIKVEDGKGKPLGRSFHVKLWPTLIFLRNGQEISRLVRPADSGSIRLAIAKL
jgi:thioredoxin 1